jgi:hypothetical protein
VASAGPTAIAQQQPPSRVRAASGDPIEPHWDERLTVTVGPTEEVTISGNELVETRGPAKRVGIRLGPLSRDIRPADNRIQGFATPIADLRTRG